MIETFLYDFLVFMLIPFIVVFACSRYQHQKRIRQSQEEWDKRAHGTEKSDPRSCTASSQPRP